MYEDKTVEKLLEGYPPNMQPKDVAAFLNISVSTVYSLIKQSDFPVLRVPGGRIHLIPKHKFLMWYCARIEKEPSESHAQS
jgi:hypothetical protein